MADRLYHQKIEYVQRHQCAGNHRIDSQAFFRRLRQEIQIWKSIDPAPLMGIKSMPKMHAARARWRLFQTRLLRRELDEAATDALKTTFRFPTELLGGIVCHLDIEDQRRLINDGLIDERGYGSK